MNQNIRFWAFLQAFQQSPYKYLYMSQMLEALEQLEVFQQENLIEKLKPTLEDEVHWLKGIEVKAESIFIEESKLLQPDINFVFYGEGEFPLPLRYMSDPPLALSYQGNLNSIHNKTISVVGSREPHEFSTEWMQTELYHFLKTERPSVISGGARGVDQRAHFISSLLNIPTVVILPSGLSQKYPALWNDKEWKDKSVIFVSEMRLGERISKKNFSSRNRLIAAWGLATLLIEARRKSGTLITAHHAIIEGRPLWIVPGHPVMSCFAGSLDIALEHAQFVRNAFDLSSLLEHESPHYLRHPLGIGHARRLSL